MIHSQSLEDAHLCVWDRLEMVFVRPLRLRVCVFTHGFHLVKSFLVARILDNLDELADTFLFF